MSVTINKHVYIFFPIHRTGIFVKALGIPHLEIPPYNSISTSEGPVVKQIVLEEVVDIRDVEGLTNRLTTGSSQICPPFLCSISL